MSCGNTTNTIWPMSPFSQVSLVKKEKERSTFEYAAMSHPTLVDSVFNNYFYAYSLFPDAKMM
jgi:hypothetical protein